jgi:molybdopterin/thiamine biosynthesis adenylyltransferase
MGNESPDTPGSNGAGEWIRTTDLLIINQQLILYSSSDLGRLPNPTVSYFAWFVTLLGQPHRYVPDSLSVAVGSPALVDFHEARAPAPGFAARQSTFSVGHRFFLFFDLCKQLLSPGGPCYRCLWEEDAEDLENCRGNGILGPVTGVIGSMMAVETLKIASGCAPSADGTLSLYDAREGAWRSLRLERDPDCPICGD